MKMKMKKIILSSVFLMVTSFSAQAGMYMPIGPNNNPFEVCEKGVPEHNWRPVDASKGTWECTKSKCRGLNPQWIPSYQAVCPAGKMKK